MKLPSKLVRVSVVALAFVLCGYGDMKSRVGWRGDFKGAKSSVSSGKFTPKVSEDAVAALGVNLDVQKLAKLVEKFFDQGLALSDESEEEQAKMKMDVRRFLDNPFANAPREVRTIVDELELQRVKVGWAVVSMEQFDHKLGDVISPAALPISSVAIATDINLERVVTYARGMMAGNGVDEEVTLDEMKLAGEKAWRIVFKGVVAREAAESNVDPCFTSLDDQLVLIARTPSALEKQIRLYREGKGEGHLLDGFKPADGSLLRLGLKDIGATLWMALSDSDLKRISLPVRDSDKLMLGLKDLDVGLTETFWGKVGLSLKLRTATEDDAESLRTLAKMGIRAMSREFAGLGTSGKQIAGIIQRMKIAGEGTVVEVTHDDAISFFSSIVVSNFIKYRKTAQMFACESNMKQLEMAVEQCRLAGHPVNDANLFGEKGYIKVKPTCPCGGEYSISEEPSGKVKITCPNALADPKYPHVLSQPYDEINRDYRDRK